MKYDLSGLSESKQAMIKTAYLSYYISMYNAVSKEIGFGDESVTVDEIYEFIQDMKHESGNVIPDIGREDIGYCFHVLHVAGICRSPVRQSNF
ncbi:MAG TPA: hypothetical protein VJL54_09575 [Nitrososphaera sp.]|jgi:hypothetical protein|nr:hypothetical protein [Nitrososphaera sp.]